jgi:hypothetical protein
MRLLFFVLLFIVMSALPARATIYEIVEGYIPEDNLTVPDNTTIIDTQPVLNDTIEVAPVANDTIDGSGSQSILNGTVNNTDNRQPQSDNSPPYHYIIYAAMALTVVEVIAYLITKEWH